MIPASYGPDVFWTPSSVRHLRKAAGLWEEAHSTLREMSWVLFAWFPFSKILFTHLKDVTSRVEGREAGRSREPDAGSWDWDRTGTGPDRTGT